MVRETFQSFSDRQIHIQNLTATLERWKDEADPSCIPPYIQAIISTPARHLQASSNPVRVNLTTSLLDVLETVQGTRTVIVHGDLKNSSKRNPDGDLIFNRLVFLERALAAPSLMEPLSSLVNTMPTLGYVYGHETLDAVLQRMLLTGFEEVGVVDGGIVTSILHVDDIFRFLSKELVALGCFAMASNDSNSAFEGQFETDERSLMVETSADVKERMDKQKEERDMSAAQLTAQQFCKCYWTEVLITICIIIDVSTSIANYSSASYDIKEEEKFEVATGIILFVFLYEALVRMYGFRIALLRLPFEIIDLGIIVVSIVVYCMVLQRLVTSDSTNIVTLVRIVRGLRMFKVVRLIIGFVVKHRMLYNRDGFALDITFVTNSCIAMSLPAVGSKANFANPIEEICRFFNTKFPERYLVFNLCAEPSYSDRYFGIRMERIMVEKHHPPKLSQMVALVECAGRFIDEDPKGCISIHCKSGKDRTGVMIAAWLMYSTFAESANDAIEWFIERRLKKRAGGSSIFMASQQRYVKYFEEILMHGGYYTKRLPLKRIIIKTCPMMDAQRGCNLWFSVDEGGRQVFCSSGRNRDEFLRITQRDERIAFDLDALVAGDICITFYNREPTAARNELCFFFCFHTNFVVSESISFEKEAVDIASTDIRCKVFHPDFSVRVEFDGLATEAVCTSSGKGCRTAPCRGAAMGPFRKIQKPSDRIIEAAARMRGRDLSIQVRSARRLNKRMHSTLTDTVRSPSVGRASSIRSPTSLCCASGPLVLHDSVDMYKNGDRTVGVVPRQLSRSFSASKYFSRSLGVKLARSLVSGNKRRFVEDGFDLDLSYITARVIAMGFPSSGIESSYRNSKEDVYRFFQQRHAAHYRIVNLCSERAYSLDTFHGNCVRYPFADHNPPALELMLPCCAHIHKYLQADPDNVIAIHCKAGKGRTGLIVIAYLMYCGLHCSALEARHFYDWARTTDGKGLTIISQIRYAHYFEQQLRVLKLDREPPLQTAQDKAPAMMLHLFRLHTIPHFNTDAGFRPSFTITVKSELDHEDYVVFRSPTAVGRAGSEGHPPLTGGTIFKGQRGDPSSPSPPDTESSGVAIGGLDKLDLSADNGTGGGGTRVAGDFQVIFRDESKGKTMFSFCLHTALLTHPPPEMGGSARRMAEAECAVEFLPVTGNCSEGMWSLLLRKHEIDGAAKDVRCAHFEPDFKCEIFFSELPGLVGTGPALEAARAAATASFTGTLPLGSDTLGGNGVEGRERPLAHDQESYMKFLHTAAAAGRPVSTFEQWLLSSAHDLASGLPVAPLHHQNESSSVISAHSTKKTFPHPTSYPTRKTTHIAGDDETGPAESLESVLDVANRRENVQRSNVGAAINADRTVTSVWRGHGYEGTDYVAQSDHDMQSSRVNRCPKAVPCEPLPQGLCASPRLDSDDLNSDMSPDISSNALPECGDVGAESTSTNVSDADWVTAALGFAPRQDHDHASTQLTPKELTSGQLFTPRYHSMPCPRS